MLLIFFILILTVIPTSIKSDSSDPKSTVEDPIIIDNSWSRKITVYSSDGKTYYNVPVSVSIPENLINVQLYRYLDSSLMKKVTNDPAYDFQVLDSDGNGLNDIVRWIVPELSEVSFSVEGMISDKSASTFGILNQGEVQFNQEGNIVTFDRGLDCHRCGQHKAPPLTDVNMTITATVSNPVTNVTLIDYYPVDWVVVGSNDGNISNFNTSYNKIEWEIENVTDSISKWYTIRSPDLTSPPTKYYFFSEFSSMQSDPWFVIVSDPTSSIYYRFMTASSDLTNLLWARNESVSTATISTNISTTSTGEACWTSAATYKGMFTVPNFTWSGTGYVLVNGTWTVSAKFLESYTQAGGSSSATCNFRAYISKINSTGIYDILTMNNAGTDVCVANTATSVSNSTAISYSDLTTLKSPNTRLNVTICVSVTSKGGKSRVAYYMNSSADSYVIIPNQTVIDNPPTWSNAQDNSSYKVYRGQSVNFSAVWQDDVALSQAWLSTNETGSWANKTTYDSPRSLSGLGPTTVNFTWTNQTGIPRVIGWKIYANDTFPSENVTNIINFTMWGWSNITWTSPSPGSSLNLNSIVTLTCFVNDTNNTGSGPIANYPVNFYNKSSTSESLLGTNYTNSSGYAVYYWNTTGLSAGNYYPKCNISSNSTLFYNASEYYQANTTVSLSNIIELTLSQALTKGIMFGDITPNTIGNPARNNTSGPSSGTEYNITVGTSSTNNIDFYVKLNQTFEAGIYINETSSTTSTSSGFSTNTTIIDSWSILGNSTHNCTNVVIGNNCWMRLYFDVGSVPSGYKQRNYTICGVVTGSNPSICG